MSLPFPLPMRPVVAADATDALTSFVGCAQLMLDPATPEPMRRKVEPRLLAHLPTLQALGVFDLFEIRDTALRTLVRDELAARGCAGPVTRIAS